MSPQLFNKLLPYVITASIQNLDGSHLRVLQGHVDGEAGAEACQGLEVGGVGQRPPALREHGEGQRLEVLPVDVALSAVHRLQQVLAGNDLEKSK